MESFSMEHNRLSKNGIQELLQEGTVIPAHPLTINPFRKIDEQRQRLLTRYYLASGAGGVAVGVHTTQFEIRRPEVNLLKEVLQLASDEISHAKIDRPFIKVAGICGPTGQALEEAVMAAELKYHYALVSNGGLNNYTEKQLIERTRLIAEIIPVFGFYLQPAVGGRILSYDFWRKFCDIENVQAIKVAAFNRYQTLDVVRAVCESGRSNDIALYTGNDDNIVTDLLTPYQFIINGQIVRKRFVGGLLGHWSVWTSKAVELLKEVKQCIANNYTGIEELLNKGVAITDMNAALFDVKNNFKGSISGIHEVLERQGLLKYTVCLSPDEILSPGQAEEIARVCKAYPYLMDDEFAYFFLKNM